MTTTRTAAGAVRCTPGASRAYARGVGAATRSRRDVWGERLLAARGGPTYDAAAKLLAPLVYATQRGRRPLTRSGVYYLPLAYPTDVYAPATFALHVADGSQIVSRRVDGPSLTIFVGRTGRERYGSCLARTTLATLADGYLPIVETAYTDANGVRYTQESFAGRIAGARSIVSFVHLTVDATEAKTGAVVRFAASDPKRLLVDDRAPVHVARGETTDLYAGWVHQLPLLQPVHVNERTYDRARDGVVAYWNRRLADGAQIVVPEPRVMNAERAILVQQLVQSWRYSVGNPYEELSFAEALDTAQVMAEYGYPTTADGILRIALDRLPQRFSSWRAGELLLAAAVNYDLYRDRKALTRETPDLATVVETLAGRQLTDGDAAGRLQPEPLSSDRAGRRRRRAGAGRRVAGSRRDQPCLVGDRPRRARGARGCDRTPARARAPPCRRARSRCGCPTVALPAGDAHRSVASVSADHGDARRLVLEPRHAVRVRVRVLPAGRRRGEGHPALPVAARLATRRRHARRRAHRLRPQHRRRRARRGVRDEPVALPRRQRSTRPARADAVRDARGRA